MKDFKLNPLTEKVKAAIKASTLLLLIPMTVTHAEENNAADEQEEKIEIIEVSTGYSSIKKSDL